MAFEGKIGFLRDMFCVAAITGAGVVAAGKLMAPVYTAYKEQDFSIASLEVQEADNIKQWFGVATLFSVGAAGLVVGHLSSSRERVRLTPEHFAQWPQTSEPKIYVEDDVVDEPVLSVS